MPSFFNESTCSFYENQRYYPFVGYSVNLLPTDRPSFSNKLGTREVKRASFDVPAGWEWVSEWEVEPADGTNNEGWLYAVDFKREWKAMMSKLHFVRRRKWVRKMKAKEGRTNDIMKRINKYPPKENQTVETHTVTPTVTPVPAAADGHNDDSENHENNTGDAAAADSTQTTENTDAGTEEGKKV